MLSRVAESLYWTARYVERAEDVTRLLDVDYHALLDAQVADHGEAWQRLVALLGDEDVYAEHYDGVHGAERRRVAALARGEPERGRELHHARAGERPLGARADLGRDVGGDQRAVPARRPREPARGRPRAARASSSSCGTARTASRGRADATMTHGEPYEFIQLGLHLERAATTVRVVRTPLPRRRRARGRRPGAGTRADRAAQVVQRVRGVREAPRRDVRAARRSRTSSSAPRQFPRSVLYCLRTCAASVDRIAVEHGAPHRVLGRLCAELEYGEVDDVSGAGVAADARRAARGDQPRRRRADEGVLLEPRPAASPRSRSRRRSSSNVADGRARHALRLRRPDQRGVHRAPAEAGAPRRPALLVVLARDRSRAGRRSPSTSTASATPCTTSTCSSRTSALVVTARSEVWTAPRLRRCDAALSPLDRFDFLAPSRYVAARRPDRPSSRATAPGRSDAAEAAAS